MENIKKFLATVPSTVWIAAALVVVIAIYWFSGDVGSWWEKRQQDKFDAKQAQNEQTIEAFKKQEAELIKRAETAEANEQAKSIEADLLRQEAIKKGVNIEEAQKVIDAATSKYQNDQEFMKKVEAGEITKYQLCAKQCKDSAEEGYPCRPNYCDPFPKE